MASWKFSAYKFGIPKYPLCFFIIGSPSPQQPNFLKVSLSRCSLTHELTSVDYENLEEQLLEKWINWNDIDRFAELKKLLEKKKKNSRRKSINCFFSKLILNTEKIKCFKKFTSLVAALNKRILKIPNRRKEDRYKFLWITNFIFENCLWKFFPVDLNPNTKRRRKLFFLRTIFIFFKVISKTCLQKLLISHFKPAALTGYIDW